MCCLYCCSVVFSPLFFICNLMLLMDLSRIVYVEFIKKVVVAVNLLQQHRYSVRRKLFAI